MSRIELAEKLSSIGVKAFLHFWVEKCCLCIEWWKNQSNILNYRGVISGSLSIFWADLIRRHVRNSNSLCKIGSHLGHRAKNKQKIRKTSHSHPTNESLNPILEQKNISQLLMTTHLHVQPISLRIKGNMKFTKKTTTNFLFELRALI